MVLSFLHPVPARIGRYTLAKTDLVQRRLCIDDPHFSAVTSHNIKTITDGLTEPAVVFIPSAYLPPGITRDFDHAGDPFRSDLRSVVPLVGFCDRIEIAGSRMEGFTPEMAGAENSAVLTSGLDAKCAERSIFVNRRFADGRPIPDILFSDPISWLVGRQKINVQLALNGQAFDALTANGKDYYATRYHLAFKQAIFNALSGEVAKIAGLAGPFTATAIGANAANALKKIETLMGKLKEDLTSSDRLILLTLEVKGS